MFNKHITSAQNAEFLPLFNNNSIGYAPHPNSATGSFKANSN